MKAFLTLSLALLLTSCAAKKTNLASPGNNNFASIRVSNRPTYQYIIARFVLKYVSLGFVELGEKAKIRSVNGVPVEATEGVLVDPGPVQLGLIYDGPKNRKSRGMLTLSFEAKANTPYTIRYDADGDNWTAEAIGLNLAVSAKGDIFTPPLQAAGANLQQLNKEETTNPDSTLPQL